MKVQLINTPNLSFNTKNQVLLNREIEKKNIDKYINSTMNDVSQPEEFGGVLYDGAKMLISHIASKDDVFIIQDSDVDGMTSAAILINYLHDVFPYWVENSLSWGWHEGKQHGLNDFIDKLEKSKYKLIICPDSGTGDVEEVKRLNNVGIDVLILDHHPFENRADTIIINSQYNYPNPHLSGAGVVWQFCKYLDKISGNNFAKDYIDLCALGLQGDMMDIRNVETKTLIFEGCKDENIKNPLMRSMIEKNEFSFTKADYKPSDDNNLFVTPMGLSFFLIPQMNAICRSGTMEEKELIFDSMLNFKAFDIIPSTKRGHKFGEMERKLDQAIRTLTNVKNRQTRAETAALELFEQKIKDENLLDHKVILILTESGVVDRNVAGLVANRLMGRHQRPCCVLTKVDKDSVITYQGSMRGYERTGIKNFKDICEASRGCEWSRGHQSAAGLCLNAEKLNEFIEDTDKALEKISDEPIYYVDYVFDSDGIDPQIILDLASMNDYLGTGIERPQVFIKNVKVNEDTMNVYTKNTVKIKTDSNIDAMTFGASDELIEELRQGAVIDIVCRCNENEWNYQKNPQLIIEDWQYSINKEGGKNKDVINMWNF